jgi:hypothetical protein
MGQVIDQVFPPFRLQVWDQVRVIVEDQVFNQVFDQVWEQVWEQKK